MHLALSDFDSQDLIFKFSGEVKSSHLFLNRVAPSALGWYQWGLCVINDYYKVIKKKKTITG